MIKKAGIGLLVLFFTISCTTTGFMGLAKESYVQQLEQENEELKEEMNSVNAENEELKEEIGTIKEDMEKVLELADEIEELEALTKGIESKLDELPEETLKKLADIIDEYLTKKKGTSERETRESDTDAMEYGDGSEEDPSAENFPE